MKNLTAFFVTTGLMVLFLACSKSDSDKPVDITIVKMNDSLMLTPITFFAVVSATPESYLWDFGDGGISHEVTPRHAYQNMGVYNIVCTVTRSGVSYKASYKLTIKGDSRLAASRHFSGTHVFNSNNPQIPGFSRVIADTVLPFTWNSPFELAVFKGFMLLNHDTNGEVQYQYMGNRENQYLRYYPANDSIYIKYTNSGAPGLYINSLMYEFVNKK